MEHRQDDPDATLNLGGRVPAAGDQAGLGAATNASPMLGPYRLLRELGRGGQGVVYEALDSRLGRSVALKILAQSVASDPLTRLRFEREATAAARLDHPGICTVYEAGEVTGALFIAMRLVHGASIAERIKRRSELLSLDSASTTVGRRRGEVFAQIEILEKVARALHVAHEAGLVHRDIKPANVMVEASGDPVILDFGLARDSAGPEVSLTGTGTFLGTPAYMSPEQVDGTQILDRRTDVWSLGVVIYEVVTGVRPFEAPTLEGLLRAIRMNDPLPPRSKNPGCTAELEAVILTAIEKDPARRYQDAVSLAEDLKRARALEPVTARPAGVLTKSRRWIQRNPLVSMSLAAVILALSAGLLVSMSSLRKTEQALAQEASARSAAVLERSRAEDLLSFLLIDLKDRLTKVGRLDLLAEVASKATRYYEQQSLSEDDPNARRNRAIALRNAGEVRLAAGDADSALVAINEAEALLTDLRRRVPDDVRAELELMTTLSVQAIYYRDLRDIARAIEYSERSLTARRSYFERHPEEKEAKRKLAGGLVLHGSILRHRNAAEALPFGDEAVALQRELVKADSLDVLAARELGVALQNLGEWHRAAGDAKIGILRRTEALQLFEALSAAHPEDREFKDLLATTLHGISLLQREVGESEKALLTARRVLPILRALAAEDPQNSQRRSKIALAQSLVAILEVETGRADLSLASYREAVDTWTALLALDPKRFDWRLERAEARRAMAECLGHLVRTNEAIEIARAAVSEFASLTKERERDAPTLRRLVIALGVLADLESEAGDGASALETTRRALSAEEARFELAGRTTWSALASVASETAWRCSALGALEEARAAAGRAVLARRRVHEAAAGKDAKSAALGQLLRALGENLATLVSMQVLDEARRVSDEIEELLPTLELEAEGDPTMPPFKSQCYAQVALLEKGSLNLDRALEGARMAVQCLLGSESSIDVRDARSAATDIEEEISAEKDRSAGVIGEGLIAALVRVHAAAADAKPRDVEVALAQLVPLDPNVPLRAGFALEVAARILSVAESEDDVKTKEVLLAGATHVLGLALTRIRQDLKVVDDFIEARRDDPAGVSNGVRKRRGRFQMLIAGILDTDSRWRRVRMREDFLRLRSGSH